MISNKFIADKIKILINLLYHLDKFTNDKIKLSDKKFENVNVILNEILDSKKLSNYFKENANKFKFINNEKQEKIIKDKEEKINIDKNNLLSFNQMNLKTINKFYHSFNEVNMINDISINKIIKIIKYVYNKTLNENQYYSDKTIINQYLKKYIFLIQSNNNKNSVPPKSNKHNNIYRNKKIKKNLFNKTLKKSSSDTQDLISQNLSCYPIRKIINNNNNSIFSSASKKKNIDISPKKILTDRYTKIKEEMKNKTLKSLRINNKNIIFKKQCKKNENMKIPKEILNLPLLKKNKLLLNYKNKNDSLKSKLISNNEKSKEKQNKSVNLVKNKYKTIFNYLNSKDLNEIENAKNERMIMPYGEYNSKNVINSLSLSKNYNKKQNNSYYDFNYDKIIPLFHKIKK